MADVIEIVPLDGSSAGGIAGDVSPSARGAGRLWLVVFVLIAAIAAWVGTHRAALESAPSDIYAVPSRALPDANTLVYPSGALCPRGYRCVAGGSISVPVWDGFERLFPTATLESSIRYFDPATARSYTERIVARMPNNVELTLTAQRAVPARTGTVTVDPSRGVYLSTLVADKAVTMFSARSGWRFYAQVRADTGQAMPSDELSRWLLDSPLPF